MSVGPPATDANSGSQPADRVWVDGQLDLLRRREVAYDEARETTLASQLVARFDSLQGGDFRPTDVAEALAVWFGSRQCRTVPGLRRYLEQQRLNPPGRLLWYSGAWLPWTELEELIWSLPDTL